MGEFWFPMLSAEPSTEEPDTAPVLAALEAALIMSAPDGWRGLTVDCDALVSRMDITATVTMGDGTVRHWSPPAVVSQWLHRLRMCDYHPGGGVWFRDRFELAPGVPLVRHTDSLTEPSGERDRRVEPELVPLFDGRDDTGRPTWYRPAIGQRELRAVLEYLESAPLVLSSRGLTDDELAGSESVVPMGFHTDGRFVWPRAAGYYLREHGVPPASPLVAHIRARRYRPPGVPTITMDRAAALAMGRPWDESAVDAKANRALRVVESVIIEKRISPRHYSVLAEREGAWCLVRDGDRYRVQWSLDRRAAILFDDVRQATAYLAGQLLANADDLAYELGEEIPAWQSPLVVLSDDPPVESFASVTTAVVEDVEVDRYGEPDGNLVFVAGTPFDRRGVPAEHAGRPYHRYRMGGGPWQVVALISAAGGRGFVLPKAISEYLRSGDLEEVHEPGSHALRAGSQQRPDVQGRA